MRRRQWAPCPAPPHPWSSATPAQGPLRGSSLSAAWGIRRPLGPAGSHAPEPGPSPTPQRPRCCLRGSPGSQDPLVGPMPTGHCEHKSRRGKVWKPPSAEEIGNQSQCWGLCGAPRPDWGPGLGDLAGECWLHGKMDF